MQQLVEKVITSMQFQIRSCRASVHVGGLPRCRADQKKLSRVLTNLLDNAMKYRSPERPLVIRISGQSEDDKSVYCVEDNGIGIDHQFQDKIFEIFHQLHPNASSGGQGLGLTIVRQIMQQQEGRIFVRSDPGQGSRFFIELPAAVAVSVAQPIH